MASAARRRRRPRRARSRFHASFRRYEEVDLQRNLRPDALAYKGLGFGVDALPGPLCLPEAVSCGYRVIRGAGSA